MLTFSEAARVTAAWIQKNDGAKTKQAAKTLNINRQLLDAKLKRYGLAENDEGTDGDH